MENNYIQNIIGKYLAGAANKEEKLLIDQWISTSEKNSAEFDLHKKVWENTTIKFRSNESESLFRELLNRIDQDSEVVSEISNGSTKIRRLLISFSKVAAALIFFAAVWYIIDFQGENKVPAPLQTAMIQKQNPAGQKSKIFLPDGSEVWLNAESSISYPEKTAVQIPAP